MAQYGQSLGMSKKPTSYADVLKQKEQTKQQVKPKFNLFDFSSVKTQQPTQTPQLNFGQPVSQRNVTNFGDYKKTIPQTPITQTQPTQKSGFSLIPTTNAEEKDLIQTFLDDNNVNVENRKTVFEMLKDNVPKNVIEDAIINKAGYKGTQPTQESFIEGVGTKTKESFLGGIKRIGEAGVGLAEGKYNIPEAFARGGAGALQSAFSPVAGVLGETIETGVEKIPQDFKDYISTKTKPTINDVKTWYDTQTPYQKRQLQNIGVGVELLANFVGAGAVQKATPVVKQGVVKTGESLTKGGKNIISKVTPNLEQKAYDISTKANRFNAKDIEDFTKITGESPGEFAVKRGMTKTGDEAVDEATKNWITSMQQADNALEQVGGNFKIQQGPDYIDGAFKGLQNKLSKYSPEVERVNQLANKYRAEGLTMPEINEVKRLYASNHKYNWLDAGSKKATTSRDIQDGLRKWQFSKAKEMGLQNLDEINRNTQGWRAFADDLAKKLKRSEGNNNISLTDWVSLSGGNPTNIALFLGKKAGESKKFKELLIRKFGKQTKDAIITPDINKPQIKGLLPKGPVITPAPEFKSGIKVTPATIQPNVKTQKALPQGRIVTPQTTDAGIIQESKIPLKKTKYGTTNNVSSNRNNSVTDTKLKPNQPKNEVSNPTTTQPKKTGRKLLNAILPSNFKEKAQDFVEGVADKVGARTKLLGGEGAKSAPKSGLELAKSLEGKYDADVIWEKTGWEKGTDGKWRFEIDDSKAKLKDGLDLDYKKTKEYLLKDVLEHDDLFKQYPNLKEVKIIDDPKYDGMGEFTPGIDSDNFFRNPSIKLNIIKMLDDGDSPKSTLLHEIQHYIQSKEGFARGGDISTTINKELVQNLKNKLEKIKGRYIELDTKESRTGNSRTGIESSEYLTLKKEIKNITRQLDDLKDEGYEGYKRLAGETEARNVQTRLLKTPSERKLLRPAKTEDVARDKQIVKMDGGKSMLLPSKVEKQVGDDLINEARKYNSFEEFKKSQGNPVYHGSNTNFNEFKKEYIGSKTDPGIVGKGFYFSDKRYFAKQYAGGTEENIINTYIKNANIFNLNDIKTPKKIADLLGMDEKNFILVSQGKIIPKNFKVAEEFGNKLQKMGYDGVKFNRYPDMQEISIFNPDVIKTETQLKQIYEQANKPKLLKKTK